jgi:tetratricopeptide (TPR) repeat protein
VPIDRIATLRNAEKLLRTGKLEPAIAEYLRVVEDQPRDWNTANTLGDLYVKANQTDKAVDQYIRIADHLNEEGFFPKASAVYKKILKLKPDHEHALLQAGEIAARQGTLAEARTLLSAVVARRIARNDARGAAQIRIRLGTLDPSDFEGRMVAASARAEIGDKADAVRDLKEIAAELADKERPKEAIEALRQAARLAPDDDGIRAQLQQVYIVAGDFARARECATTAEQFKDLATRLEALGRSEDALTLLRDAARVDPSDVELRSHLARTFAARGDMAAAAEYLTIESAAGDPDLLLVVAEIRLRGGQIDEAVSIAKGLLADDPSRRDAIARAGGSVAAQAPDAGFAFVEIAADASLASGDPAGAAAILQDFVGRAPHHIPALLRLVEIAVDGGVEATMNAAQAQLADAYLAAGQAEDARFIAEELVAREPWNPENLQRFRATLVMLGESDPDAIIAERLGGGGTPFTSTDLKAGDFPEFQAPASSAPEPEAQALENPFVAPPSTDEREPAAATGDAYDTDTDTDESGPWTPPTSQFKRPAHIPSPFASEPAPPPAPPPIADEVDIKSVIGDLESAPPMAAKSNAPGAPSPATAHASSEDVEVDLSIVLDDIRRPAAAPVPAPRPAPPPPVQSEPAPRMAGLESVFDHVRDDATRKTALDLADTLYRHALALREAGDLDGCIESLKFASRAPKFRFQTASLLGRLYRDRGQMSTAVEWFEKAAQAPAPTQDESYLLLYDLADALERQGETARSLAICLELQAEAGDYEDLEQRIDRLSKVQARG